MEDILSKSLSIVISIKSLFAANVERQYFLNVIIYLSVIDIYYLVGIGCSILS